MPKLRPCICCCLLAFNAALIYIAMVCLQKRDVECRHVTVINDFKCPRPERILNYNQELSTATLRNTAQYMHVIPIYDSVFLIHDQSVLHQVDGDRAQQSVVRNIIQLKEECKRDSNTIVVDVGAFAGDFGLMAASLGCQVHMFEPIPLRHTLIAASIYLNGYQSNVHLYNNAICSSKTRVNFTTDDGLTRQSSGEQGQTFTIPCLTLDELFPVEHIFLLKVDVEGFEYDVLFNSSRRILQENRVRHLITEYTPFWTDHGRGPWTRFLTDIRRTGTVYTLQRTGPEIYGPIDPSQDTLFHDSHITRHLQTDLYINYDRDLTIAAPEWDEGVGL